MTERATRVLRQKFEKELPAMLVGCSAAGMPGGRPSAPAVELVPELVLRLFDFFHLRELVLGLVSLKAAGRDSRVRV